jgi:hypothetical protein
MDGGIRLGFKFFGAQLNHTSCNANSSHCTEFDLAVGHGSFSGRIFSAT